MKRSVSIFATGCSRPHPRLNALYPDAAEEIMVEELQEYGGTDPEA